MDSAAQGINNAQTSIVDKVGATKDQIGQSVNGLKQAAGSLKESVDKNVGGLKGVTDDLKGDAKKLERKYKDLIRVGRKPEPPKKGQ